MGVTGEDDSSHMYIRGSLKLCAQLLPTCELARSYIDCVPEDAQGGCLLHEAACVCFRNLPASIQHEFVQQLLSVAGPLKCAPLATAFSDVALSAAVSTELTRIVDQAAVVELENEQKDARLNLAFLVIDTFWEAASNARSASDLANA